MPTELLDLVAKDFLSGEAGRELEELAKGALEPPARGTSVTDTLRTSHHLLAQHIAEGSSDITAANRCGMSIGRVKRLRGDPAFEELVAYYKAQNEDLFGSIKERLAAMGLTFLDILHERALQDPDKFTPNQLKDISEMLLDRSVAPALNTSKAGEGQRQTLPNITIQFVEGAKLPGVTIESEAPAKSDLLADLG